MVRDDPVTIGWLSKPRTAALTIALLFVVIAGITTFLVHHQYVVLKGHALESNGAVTRFTKDLILQHNMAAVGLLRAYASRPLLIDAVKRRDVAAVHRHMADLKKNSNEIDLAFVTDKKGILWANFPVFPEAIGKDLSDRDWYKGVKGRWKPYISAVFRLIVWDKPLAIAVAVPVLDRDGAVIGVLASSMRLAVFAHIISEIPLPPYTRLTVIDRIGNIIYSTRLPYATEITGYPLLSPVKGAIEAGKDYIEITGPEGSGTVVLSVSRAAATGWTVIAERDAGDVLRAEYRRFLAIVTISLFLFLSISVLLLHVRNRAIFAGRRQLSIYERKLGQEEERFRELFEHMSSAVAVYEARDDGEDFIFKDFNRAAEEIERISRDQLIGRSVKEVFPAVKDTGLFAIFQRVYRTGAPEKHPAVLYMDQRIAGWKENYVCRLPSGEIVAIYDDITERKRADEALRLSERRYRIAQAVGHVGNWEYNLQTNHFWGSDEAGRIFGLDPERAYFTTDEIENRIPERERVHQALCDLIESGKVYDLEFEILPKDSSEPRIVSSIAELQRDEHGDPLAVIGVIQDITERKHGEAKLTESEAKYRSIFHNATEGIFQTTPDGRFISVNPAMAAIYGYESPEEMTRRVTDIGAQLYADPEERARYRQTMREEGKVEGFEAQFVKRDGTPIWCSIRAHAVQDMRGVVLYLEGSVEDITERKRTERRLFKEMERKNTLLFVYENAPHMTDRGLYEYFLEQAVRLTDSAVGFLHLVTPDQKTVILTAWSREALKNCTASYETPYPVEQAGNWVDCIRLKRPVVYNDFPCSPNRQGLPEGHAPILRFMSVPVVEEDKVSIVFGVGNKAEEYNEDDIIQIQFLATDLKTIVRQRRAEKAKSETEERYRSIFENTIEGIFQISPEGRLITVNPAMAHMHGFASPEEMIASVTNFSEQIYVNPEDRESYWKLLEEGGAVEGFEAKFYKKDGAIIWVSLNARSVKSLTGEILYYEGAAENVTSRKAAEEEVKETLRKLRESLAGTIQAMSSMVEIRDPYTAGHQRRVAGLARAIAQEMILPKEIIDNIIMAGAIHDIGKMSVPAEILSKPGKITDVETSLIHTHPQSGYDILKDAKLPYPIAEIVLQHHERLDGSGYPQKLMKGQILLEAQIVAAADVVESIASHRPYRAALGIDAALEEIERNKGKLYNAEVVEACMRLFKESGFTFEQTDPFER